MSRSQISQQLVFLLKNTGILGGSTSAFETSLAIEAFLASGFTFPIAAVQTEDSRSDLPALGRQREARFRISVAGQSVAEALKANYPSSGGSASSQQKLEQTIRSILSSLNSLTPGEFLPSTHGFQGIVYSISAERLVVAQGTSFSVANIDVEAYDCTYTDSFASGSHLGASVGGGVVSLSWILPPARFDTVGGVLRRGTNPGDASPPTVTSGTGVAITGGVGGVAASDTPGGSGTYNYAYFTQYSGGNTSSPLKRAVVV